MDSIIGILFRDWIRLLKKHRFRIHPKNWIKSLFITCYSIVNSKLVKKELQQFDAAVRNTKIEKEPVCIIGHWRSGTTFLHNLMSRDKQFAFINAFEGRNVHTFLSRQKLFEKRLQMYAAQKRVMDNIHVHLDDPVEEEFALAVMTMQSPLIGWLFPQSRDFYDRYVTFDNIPPEEFQNWKENYIYLSKKLTYKYNKQLLYKSPLNTARIRHLLEIFPNAKFIHIHRNPYDVFRSSLKLFNTAVRNSHLTNTNDQQFDDYIISHYKTIYNSFFNDLALIKNGNYSEIAFEDLEKDAASVIEKIYGTLGLENFDAMKPHLLKYLESQSRYQKNTYKQIDENIKQKINTNWERNFRAWGYAMQ